MKKSISKITDLRQQQAETYRYWQSLLVGDLLTAVWEASVDAYAVKGVRLDDEQISERTLTRVQRKKLPLITNPIAILKDCNAQAD
jgi:hypothetical protein